jgi:Cytochrome P450
VIKEGLRIWPPVVGLMAKEVPAGGDMLCGKFVPGGTQVGYSAFGLFRDKATWGEDAGVFRPERWLEIEGTDEERMRIQQMENNLDLIFAAGKWQCLGRNVAQMELNKVFVEVRPPVSSLPYLPAPFSSTAHATQLLRNFDFQIANPDQPWKCFTSGIFALSEMWMFVQRREDAPPLY